jgi:alpha-glucoside transport system substrate-binding protein
MVKKSSRVSAGILMLILVMVVTACSGPSSASNSGSSSSSSGASSTAGGAAAGSVATAPAAASTGVARGTVDTSISGNVLILGAFTGGEASAFQSTLNDFMAQYPNVKVTYQGTNQFETLISVRVAGGDVPDVAAFPQPGGVARFATAGNLVPLWPEAVADYTNNYGPAWKDLASVNGQVYGMFHRVNAKGFIWYNKPAWDKAGWQIPKTWADLQTLAQQMQQKTPNIAPFCDGLQAGASSGWKGTDWIENFVLRTQPLSYYNKWAAGNVPFSDPGIQNAFNLLGKVWLDPKMTYGGPQTVASTDVPTPATWLFGSQPKCWMHMEGSFVVNFFPQNVRQNLDQQVGYFIMPPVDTAKVPTPPVEVGGDEYVVFKGHDTPAVKAFINWLGTPAAGVAWTKLGGALFAYKNQDFNNYPTKIEGHLAQDLVNAKSVAFDASDNMPSKENLAFWKGVTDWVSGTSLQQATQEIDNGSK